MIREEVSIKKLRQQILLEKIKREDLEKKVVNLKIFINSLKNYFNPKLKKIKKDIIEQKFIKGIDDNHTKDDIKLNNEVVKFEKPKYVIGGGQPISDKYFCNKISIYQDANIEKLYTGGSVNIKGSVIANNINTYNNSIFKQTSILDNNTFMKNLELKSILLLENKQDLQLGLFDNCSIQIKKINDEIITKLTIRLNGLYLSNKKFSIIGIPNKSSFLLKWNQDILGILNKIEVICISSPKLDSNLSFSTSNFNICILPYLKSSGELGDFSLFEPEFNNKNILTRNDGKWSNIDKNYIYLQTTENRVNNTINNNENNNENVCEQFKEGVYQIIFYSLV